MSKKRACVAKPKQPTHSYRPSYPVGRGFLAIFSPEPRERSGNQEKNARIAGEDDGREIFLVVP